VKIGVIGGGGWGTALSIVLESRGHQVTLWVYEADLAEHMQRSRVNERFLPGVSIPEAVKDHVVVERGLSRRGEPPLRSAVARAPIDGGAPRRGGSGFARERRVGDRSRPRGSRRAR
jgi:hypothetical protein